MKKRILSAILCFVTVLMIQSVLCCAEVNDSSPALVYDVKKNYDNPSDGFGEVIFKGTLYDAFEYVNFNGLGKGIVLNDDVKLDKSLTLNPLSGMSTPIIIIGDVVLDLNGNFITQCSGTEKNDNPLFVVPTGSSLVIKDSSDRKNGLINGVQCAIGVDGGDVTIEGGRVIAQSGATENDDGELPVKVISGGGFILSGGTIDFNGELLDGRTYTQASGAICAESGANVSIQSGEVFGPIICEDADLKITGGSFSDTVEKYLSAEYECISDGQMFTVQRKVPQVSGIYNGMNFDVALDMVYDKRNDRIEKYVVAAKSETLYRQNTKIDISQIFSLLAVLEDDNIPKIEIQTDAVTVLLDKDIVRSLADSYSGNGIYFVSETTDNVSDENKNILKNARKQIFYKFVDAENNEIKPQDYFTVTFPYFPENTGDVINVYDVNGTRLNNKNYTYSDGSIQFETNKSETILVSDGYGLRILGRALDLQGTISMIYYAMPENLDINSVKMLFWTSPQTEYTLETAERVVEADGKALIGYKFVYKNISSKDMNKEIYARLMATDADGDVLYSPIPNEGYSIRKYAQNMMKDEKLRPLLIKMLNYGAAAQEYFGSEEEPVNLVLPVGERATDFTKIYRSESQTMSEDGPYGKSSAQIDGKTLLLDGDISIKYYTSWQGESGYDEAGVLFWTENAFKANRNHVSGTESYKTTYFENNGDYRVFTYPNIVSSAMNEQIYARIYVRYGNEYKYSDIDSYSVRDYAANQLAKNSDTALVKLLRTLMLYGEEAEKYFKRGISE